MATAKKNNFTPEDFSRFLIREFLKKSGFDRTYDIFMTEDQRPKVTMTKSELTNLLGMDNLVRQNNKSKAFNTMLDVISNYLSSMKVQQGGVSLVPGADPIANSASTAGSKSMNRAPVTSGGSETTQASTISQQSIQNRSKLRGEGAGPLAAPYGGPSQAAAPSGINNRLPPQTADPYGSNKPAPIGQQAKTGQNFFSGARNSSGIGNLNQPSSNSLFGGDSNAQPVGTGKPKANNFTNVVADDDEDDWDAEDVSAKVNQREGNGMGFFNRAPLQNQYPTAQAGTKSSTMSQQNNRQVPENSQQRAKPQGGFMTKNVPTKDNGLDDFDDDDWPTGQNNAKGPGNPALRQQQFNAVRPQTSGKPGQRGFHGIGKNPAKPNMAATGAGADDLDDMLDGFGGGVDPLTAINQNKQSAQKKRQQKQPAAATVDDDDDPLGFLKKAAEESKKNEERRNQAAQDAITSYKSLDQMQYNLDGYQPPERDNYQAGGGGLQGSQASALTPEETSGIKKLLFRNGTPSFHPSWAQGFYFDQKMHYAIFQDKGGPCGILATVQAFFLKHLLFVQKQTLTNINMMTRNNIMASAITDILLNSASGNPSGAVQLVLPQNSGRSFGGGAGRGKCVEPSQCHKQTLQRGPDQRRRVLQAVQSNIASFVEQTGPGVVCLVYSVMLSKGVEQMEADFDFEISLINEYGYASQELINTMLVGKSATNVHDGDKEMGDDLVLKGIHKRSEIGFLTFYEHYGHFEVGENYKKPVLPIWIVCSESHYSILFSANFSLASQHITANSRPFDLIYYDELARQADDIILTVEPGKYQEGGQRGMDGRQHKQHTIPIDSVIRTKWKNAKINWNGRTVIL